MRPVILAAAVLLLALATWSIFARSRERERLAERYFSVEQIARGRQFAFERRLLFWSFEAAQLALLGWLAFSGAAARIAERCAALASSRWWLTTLLVGAALFLAQELLALPWSVYGGLYHMRAWGLTDRSFGSWLADHLKALLVSGAAFAFLLLGFYGLIRFSPRWWWLLAGLGSAIVAAFFAYLAPVLIAPLFNAFVPLRTTPYATLQPRIEALAQKAGLPVKDVLVMDASRQGRHTNAYFTGFFGTRRIVLYDTLLKSHGEEETLSILGHEMGHWRRHHIVKGIALGTLGALLGFFLLAQLLERAAASSRFGLRHPADPAGLPLILLLSALAGFASLPVQNAVSRAFEREADRDALELYGHPEVFIEAEKRLARDNISNVAPSDLNVFLFATHPPTLDRIAAAERDP
jgi:STE24 endopeptidase